MGSPLFIDEQFQPIPPAWLRKMKFCFAFPVRVDPSPSFLARAGLSQDPLPFPQPDLLCHFAGNPCCQVTIPTHTNSLRELSKKEGEKSKNLSEIPVGWRLPAIRGAVVLWCVAALGSELRLINVMKSL